MRYPSAFLANYALILGFCLGPGCAPSPSGMVASRELDLYYTKVIAPVSGRVSRYDVTVGNLIQSGDQNGGTLLTTIVSVDPMYAYSDVDERTVQRVRQFAREGKVASADATAWLVSLGLATEEGFPHQGTINFVDNQVNAKTGTLHIRGVFPNKDGALTPGFFARVRLPVSPPHRALLVSERALDNDQGQKVLVGGLATVWLLTPVLGPRLGLPVGDLAAGEGPAGIKASLLTWGADLILFLPGAVAGGALGWFLIRPVNWVLGKFFGAFNRGFE